MKMRGLCLLLLLFLPSFAKAEFGFHAGSHFGYGKMGNEDGTVPDRDMGTFDLQFMPGYRLPFGLMPGLFFDYRFMSQLTDQSETYQTDYSGRGFLWGLGATFEPGPLKILVSYDFQARHWFSGPDTTFMGSGFHFLFGYKFMPGFAFDLEYVQASYDNQVVNGSETRMNNNEISHWNLGFGLSYSY